MLNAEDEVVIRAVVVAAEEDSAVGPEEVLAAVPVGVTFASE